jgi:hypothetical protein
MQRTQRRSIVLAPLSSGQTQSLATLRVIVWPEVPPWRDLFNPASIGIEQQRFSRRSLRLYGEKKLSSQTTNALPFLRNYA